MSKELEQVFKTLNGIAKMVEGQVKQKRDTQSQEQPQQPDFLGYLLKEVSDGLKENPSARLEDLLKTVISGQKPESTRETKTETSNQHATQPPSFDELLSAILLGIAPQMSESQPQKQPEQTVESDVLFDVKQRLEHHGFDVQQGRGQHVLDVKADGEVIAMIRLAEGGQLYVNETFNPSLEFSEHSQIVARLKADLKTALTIGADDKEVLRLSAELEFAIKKQDEMKSVLNHKIMLYEKVLMILTN
ncbi:hypothetical protein JMA_43800 (plasmid) [Jeotgalibacillus malaysiensis]|uniref:Uncharacterized protein n=1 Tax=Jeotgalibacillus malaysiensis TaxID=1508404 RepID=A0A0B5AYF6_9BACL|nr:hypothetical protein [Jeotgalibacillus malaysiensis]AJD93697.1 hypothetical protein JMA_43800 [Jeotgalibacillus malaysiensis]